jgi:hypothetical protein
MTSIETIWAATVEESKQTITAVNLWRALEKTVAITLENGVLVVGIEGVDGMYMPAIQSKEHQMNIENVLRRITGDPTMKLRLIEGKSMEDWAYAKALDAATVQQTQKTFLRQSAESTSFGSWEDIYEQVGRLWANAPSRSLSTGKGRFMDAALTLVSEAIDKIYPTFDTKQEDLSERGLSRVVERLGNYTGTDPVVIMVLLLAKRNK